MNDFRVLMIEDNPGDLRLLREILDYVGVDYEQRVARSGEEAITMLSSTSWKPDFIFIDLNLPGKSGWDVLEFMNSQKGLAVIPKVVITGSLDEESIKRAQDLGANLAIEKYRDMSGFDSATKLIMNLVNKLSLAEAPQNSCGSLALKTERPHSLTMYTNDVCPKA